jgi:hypothetical protein
MSARALTRDLGGRWHGSYGACLCPAHDDRTPSLTVRDGADAVLLTCHAGCERGAIIQALQRLGHWTVGDRSDPRRARPTRSAPEYPGPAQPTFEAVWTWRAASPLRATLAERYLRARGLLLAAPPALRYVPDLPCPSDGVRRPALVAGIQASTGQVVAIHRTYLAPDGRAKADVPAPKMMLGQLGDGAIRLAPADHELGLAEGIETALSVMALGGPPTWAAMSCGRLASVAVPSNVRAVRIFADAGAPGHQGAQRAVERHTAAGRRVVVHTPPRGFSDFNDVLTGYDAQPEAA